MTFSVLNNPLNTAPPDELVETIDIPPLLIVLLTVCDAAVVDGVLDALAEVFGPVTLAMTPRGWMPPQISGVLSNTTNPLFMANVFAAIVLALLVLTVAVLLVLCF